MTTRKRRPFSRDCACLSPVAASADSRRPLQWSGKPGNRPPEQKIDALRDFDWEKPFMR